MVIWNYGITVPVMTARLGAERRRYPMCRIEDEHISHKHEGLQSQGRAVEPWRIASPPIWCQAGYIMGDWPRVHHRSREDEPVASLSVHVDTPKIIPFVCIWATGCRGAILFFIREGVVGTRLGVLFEGGVDIEGGILILKSSKKGVHSRTAPGLHDSLRKGHALDSIYVCIYFRETLQKA